MAESLWVLKKAFSIYELYTLLSNGGNTHLLGKNLCKLVCFACLSLEGWHFFRAD